MKLNMSERILGLGCLQLHYSDMAHKNSVLASCGFALGETDEAASEY